MAALLFIEKSLYLLDLHQVVMADVVEMFIFSLPHT